MYDVSTNNEFMFPPLLYMDNNTTIVVSVGKAVHLFSGRGDNNEFHFSWLVTGILNMESS